MCALSGFHTQKGYELASESQLTSAMEDYLEMIFRLSRREGYTRIHLLAQSLQVKPSSASKMVDHLKELGMVAAEKYGCVKPTGRGGAVGDYLLYRHELLNRFLCKINGTQDELALAERIEHYFDERTIRNIEQLMREHGWWEEESRSG